MKTPDPFDFAKNVPFLFQKFNKVDFLGFLLFCPEEINEV